MITISGLTKAYGARVLFRDVTFRLLPGRRIALVGGNGVGKTTLLEIVLGTRSPTPARSTGPRTCASATCPRSSREWGGGTVLDEVLAGPADDPATWSTASTSCTTRSRPPTGADHDRALAAYGEAQTRFEQLGGYALEAEAHRCWPGSASRPATPTGRSPSCRAAGACGPRWPGCCSPQPDVLVLDEPTNHLDADSVAWLEEHLAAYPGAILFVSHDRDFIDAVAERVIELAGGTATEYVGGFAEFVVQREERLAQARAAAARQQPRRSPRPSGSSSGSATRRPRPARCRAASRRSRSWSAIEVPDRRELVARFGFPEPRRSSRVVAELEDVTVGYDGDAGPDRRRPGRSSGARSWRSSGPNGAGKTTLLRLLLGELTPMSGDVHDRRQRRRRLLRPAPGRGARPRAAPWLQEFQAAVGAGQQGPQPAHGARLVRLLGRRRRPQGRRPVRRRADPPGAGQGHGQPGQPAGARRADQPPRPAQLRRAGGRAATPTRARRAGHPRPLPHPRGRHVAPGRAGRPGPAASPGVDEAVLSPHAAASAPTGDRGSPASPGDPGGPGGSHARHLRRAASAAPPSAARPRSDRPGPPRPGS